MSTMFFDADYYLAQYQDVRIAVAAGQMTALQHWENWGWLEERNPNAEFNTAYYAANNPDVVASGMNYLTHYLLYGAAEGRKPNESWDDVDLTAFDKERYLADNPDVAEAGMDALQHYMLYGRFESNRGPVYLEDGTLIDNQTPGLTFELTSEVDDLDGTAFADTFRGVASGPLSSTYNTGDYIDGKDGNDTFLLTASSDYSEANVVELKSIENVVIRNYADSDLDLTATLWSGVKSYGVEGGNYDVYVNDIKEAFSEVVLKDWGTDETDEAYFDLIVSNSVFTGNADEVTVIVDNAGVGPIPRRLLDNDDLGGGDEIEGEYGILDIYNENGDQVVEIYNIVSTGNNDRGNFLQLYGAEAMTTLNISGTTDLRFNPSYSYDTYKLTTVDASALNANLWLRGICGGEGPLTVTGAQGNNDIALGDTDKTKTLTTFDGNDKIMAGQGDGDVIIDTAGGNDEVHTDNVNDAEALFDIDLGAGDDIIHLGTTLLAKEGTVLDLIDGGDGFDTIAMYGEMADAATIPTGYAGYFQNFEAIKLCHNYVDHTFDMALLDNINYVILGYSYDVTTTIKNVTDGGTLEYQEEGAGQSVVVNLKTTTGDQTFNVVINGDSEGGDDGVRDDVDQDYGTLTINGVETINLSMDNRCKDFDLTDADGTTDGIDISYIGYALALNADAVKATTITGATGLYLDLSATTTANTIDASAMTNDLGLALGTGLETVTGAAGVNTYIYTAVAQSQGTKVDVITNFQGGKDGDLLDLSAVAPGGEYVGTANGYGAVLTTLDGTAGMAVLDSATSILYVDVDGSQTLDSSDMAIELTGVTGLTDADNFVWA